jgi:DNA (cytosine-5)-methyltransferase 1
MTFKLLDLFSGIGGFSLGLERSGGFETMAFCEIDPFCRKVLKKHWPHVPQYDDIKILTAERLRADGIVPDAICGGFPCQDISVAGAGAGLDGERSGLWFEYARLISEIRPRVVIVENVGALLVRGLSVILGNLATLGYDAEWDCLPACTAGFEHERDRIWIVAYPHDHRELQLSRMQPDQWRWFGNDPAALANADEAGLPRWCETGANRSDARDIFARVRSAFRVAPDISREHWNHQPIVGRRIHGISDRVDRIKALGNAVVPQIPEMIGRSIMAAGYA